MENEKIYSLYIDKEEKKLLALAYSKEELKKVSLEYSSGVWYEHDVEVTEEGSTLLWNEKIYKGKITFGNEFDIQQKKLENKDIKLKTGFNSGINLLQ